MMALVNKYHSDLVSTTHVHLAHECESRGDYRAAENHFVNAGEWKLAVKMYRTLDMWEEAYKVTGHTTTCICHPYHKKEQIELSLAVYCKKKKTFKKKKLKNWNNTFIFCFLFSIKNQCNWQEFSERELYTIYCPTCQCRFSPKPLYSPRYFMPRNIKKTENCSKHGSAYISILILYDSQDGRPSVLLKRIKPVFQ